jgi:multidrug transporter EmrE-like cation transporter
MSNMVYIVLLVICIITNAGGGILMKMGSKNVAFGQGESLVKTGLTMISNWQLIIGIVSYGLSFVFSTLVYTKISLNIAYPIAVGSSFLLISIASVLFFSEKFTPIQIFGSILLITGIILIASNFKKA